MMAGRTTGRLRLLAAMAAALATVALASCGASSGGGSPSPGQGFGLAYSRWQLSVPGAASNSGLVTFSDGLVVVSVPGGSRVNVTGYREATGTKVWSRAMPSPPVSGGNLLLVAGYPVYAAAYAAAPAGPSAISRIDASTGRVLWTSRLAGGACTMTASSGYVVCGTTILSASNGATLLVLPAPSQAWAFRNGILVQDGSMLTLDALRAGRLHPLWRRDVSGYTVVPPPPNQLSLSQIMVIRGVASVLPGQVALVDAASGRIGRPAMAAQAAATGQGLNLLSPAGRLVSVSATEVDTGPRSPGFEDSGGILWSYRSPNGYSTGSVYASAIAPDSFRPLGRLVATRSQVSAEGNDSVIVSDGRYAAIAAAPVIYLFKL